MNRNVSLTFTIYLLIIIWVVGIIQSFVEWNKSKSIHFLCPIVDTFVIPKQNREKIVSGFDKLEQKFQSITTTLDALQRADSEENWSNAESSVEEALALSTEIKKNVVAVNRYKTIRLKSKEYKTVDSLVLLCQALYSKVQDRAAIEPLQKELKNFAAFKKIANEQFPKPSIVEYCKLVAITTTFYTVLDREYLRKYEDELKEASVVANTLRPMAQVLHYVLFRDLGDKAVEGKDKWLFYKQDVEYLMRPYILSKRSRVVDAEDKPLRDNAIDSIVAFKNELSKLGIELLVMVVPGKPSVYPEKLASVPADLSCTFSHSIRSIQELNSRGVQTVNLFQTFAQSRKDPAEASDPLYLSQDTHWRARGVDVVAKAVADMVRVKPWFSQSKKVEFVLDTVTIHRIGDVGTMTKIPEYKVRSLNLSFGFEKTLCSQVYQVKRDEKGTIVSKSLFRDDFQNSQILIIGDSFSRIYQNDEPGAAGWISHLAYELSTPVSSIVSDGGASTLVREKLARKKSVLDGKKIVIWEFVERDFRFGAEGWKDIKL